MAALPESFRGIAYDRYGCERSGAQSSARLFTEDGDEQIRVSITLENGDEKISLEDADVQAILEGIKVKK